tara:strand:+ start:2172 stop:3314 length:1143 start_codon:yes stop_codon:yes gene_type:complete
MSKFNTNINIESEISKSVLNSIIDDNKINYKKLKIAKLKKDIEKLKYDYNKIKLKIKNIDYSYRYFLFWEIVKKKYSKNIISLKLREQKKNNKVNVVFSDIGKALGYNPSLLSLLLFDKEIKIILKYDNFFKELQKNGDLENINSSKKISIINKISKGKLQLVTPLCPDYEHVKIAFGLYKYTFNKLNEDVGLIGSRLLKIAEKMHDIFKKYKIGFNHNLYYGDFEAYTKDILDRLKENENSFILKIEKSCKKMNKISKANTKAYLLVKSLSNKKKFLNTCKKNERLLREKMKKDIVFKKIILDITASRSALYSSWYPNYTENDYRDLVIKQGAEYVTMGQMFVEKFKNVIIIGLDHPKMGFFYNIFDDVTAIYGRPKYA